MKILSQNLLFVDEQKKTCAEGGMQLINQEDLEKITGGLPIVVPAVVFFGSLLFSSYAYGNSW